MGTPFPPRDRKSIFLDATFDLFLTSSTPMRCLVYPTGFGTPAPTVVAS